MSGQWWENDLIVGPFTDLAAANAWAAANPSSLFPGLLATAGGVQIRWGGVGVGWVTDYAGPAGNIGAVLIGDSHNALSGGTAPISDAYTANLVDGWWAWHQIATKHEIPTIANLAVGGTRCDQIALTVDAAIAYRPEWIVDSSYTNNMVQHYDHAESIAIKEAYLQKILASHIKLIIFIAPTFNSMSAAQQNDAIKHRQWCYSFAEKNNGVTIVDAMQYFVDPASATLATKSGTLRDVYHLSAKSSYEFAKYIYQNVKIFSGRNRNIPAITSPLDNQTVRDGSVNICDNSGFSGSVAVSSAGCSGNAPTNWAVTRPAGVGSVVASVASGVFGQDFALTFSGAALNDMFVAQYSPSAGVIAAIKGKTIYIEYERDYAGVSGVCEDQIEFYVNGKNSYGLVYRTTTAHTDITNVIDRTGEVVICGPFIVASDATTIRANLRTIFGASGAGTITRRKFRILDAAKLNTITRV